MPHAAPLWSGHGGRWAAPGCRVAQACSSGVAGHASSRCGGCRFPGLAGILRHQQNDREKYCFKHNFCQPRFPCFLLLSLLSWVALWSLTAFMSFCFFCCFVCLVVNCFLSLVYFTHPIAFCPCRVLSPLLSSCLQVCGFRRSFFPLLSWYFLSYTCTLW